MSVRQRRAATPSPPDTVASRSPEGPTGTRNPGKKHTDCSTGRSAQVALPGFLRAVLEAASLPVQFLGRPRVGGQVPGEKRKLADTP